MKNCILNLTGVVAAIGTLSLLTPVHGLAQESVVIVDVFVPHVSTVPANAGDKVGIFVREKISKRLKEDTEGSRLPPGRAVLFVHGSLAPSLPVFDLPYQDYSWMVAFAEGGFDAFAMDHTGFGRSPRPEMNDPCNFDAEAQSVVMPNPLVTHCDPTYGYTLTNSQSDWDEIDTVVDYIRELRGVERVSLVGWSRGGPRTAGYAARHPEKVDKLVLLAPAYSALDPSVAPRNIPRDGFPMTLITREMYMQERWHGRVACDGQIDPDIEPIVWQTILGVDPLGSVWGPPDGVLRVSTATQWGWNKEYAGRVQAPTLIFMGEQDFLFEAAEPLYSDLTGTASKVLITMECATHYAFWEGLHYKLMQDVSMEWLTTGKYQGQTGGVYTIRQGAQ